MTDLIVGTSLVPSPGTLVDPSTGEVHDLAEQPVDWLGGAMLRLKALEAELKEARAEVEREAIRRMDAEALWTLRAGELKLTSASPGAVDYDQKLLEAELNGLAAKGVIDGAAVERAFNTREVVSVSNRGVNALLKLGGEVEEAIKRCQRPKRRYVRVEEAE